MSMIRQFASLGFRVNSGEDLAALALHATRSGKRERAVYGGKTYDLYHADLGEGFQIWAVVDPAGDGLIALYPAYLAHSAEPFTVERVQIESEPDFAGYMHGTRRSTPAEFFCANLLAVQGWQYQPGAVLHVALAGLASALQIFAPGESRIDACFLPARELRPEWDEPAQYAVCGTITGATTLKNPLSGTELAVLKLRQPDVPDTEIIIPADEVRGSVRQGMIGFAQCWLQGHVLLPKPPASNGHTR